MHEDTADAIYDVLESECGAPSAYRGAFQNWMSQGGREFRFMGHLGFGGKVYMTSDRWYVACYREDETPDRKTMIDKANARLIEVKLATEKDHVRSAS